MPLHYQSKVNLKEIIHDGSKIQFQMSPKLCYEHTSNWYNNKKLYNNTYYLSYKGNFAMYNKNNIKGTR